MTESGRPRAPGGSSKLRLSAKANGRLLKGYGPLAALLVAFVLMAMLVPTKAPQQDVVHETQSAGTAGAAGARRSDGDAAPGRRRAAGGAAGGRRPAGRRGGRRGRGGRQDGGVRAAGAATGKTGGCPGQTEQVPGDPYSPPCIAFSGSNGGATSPGVSANAINVTYRITVGLRELPADAGLAGRRQHHRHHGRHRAHGQGAGHLLRQPLPVLRAQAQHRVLQRPGLHHQRAARERPAAGRRRRGHRRPDSSTPSPSSTA